MKILILSFLFIIVACQGEKVLTEVKCIKIHSVEDYATERQQSYMKARFPHVVYEVVDTGERFSIMEPPLCHINEIIKIER